ncbi:MAG: AAA family ATPase [Microbacteriaceae bacterium]
MTTDTAARDTADTADAAGPLTAGEVARASETLDRVAAAYDATMIGQAGLRRSLLVALVTGGHVLLESVPGLAKTTAAQALADAVGGSFARIQCTPDLLPSDIVGAQVYNAKTADFETRLGPVHANIVLLDEINRSSAKTQSAMLEAMQEHQTTIGGEHFRLPDPFLVLATQNPIEHEGTYRLPEAQLDRFLLKEVLDYPAFDEEVRIVGLVDSGVFERPHEPAAGTEDVLALRRSVRRVHLDPAITNYIVSLVYVTRNAGQYIAPELAGAIEFGASPRASIAFARAARALALIAGRDHVIPEDVKELRHVVLRHRLILGFEAVADGIAPETVIDAIVDSVKAP